MRTPAALLLVLLVVAGCGWQPPSEPSQAPVPPSAVPAASSAAPSAAPASSVASGEYLVTLAYRGGHCRNGPCDRTVAIARDGVVHQVAPQEEPLGKLSPDRFAEIRQQLSVTDFEALGSRPFTGECPVNFDGQELIYTFHGATGDIRLASCEVELDPSHPAARDRERPRLGSGSLTDAVARPAVRYGRGAMLGSRVGLAPLLVALAPLLVALVVAACGILPGTEPAPTGPLVTLETRGGDCPAGTCGATVVIERDGWVRDVAPRAVERGRVPEDLRRALEEAIRTTDFAALQARPFTGECPVTFDGQEQIWTFGTAAGPVRLASCEVEIDPAHPLFVAAENAFASLAAP